MVRVNIILRLRVIIQLRVMSISYFENAVSDFFLFKAKRIFWGVYVRMFTVFLCSVILLMQSLRNTRNASSILQISFVLHELYTCEVCQSSCKLEICHQINGRNVVFGIFLMKPM